MYLDEHKIAEDKMEKAVSAYRGDLQTIRAGRANPALLDKVMVNYYGEMTPINQTANISAPEAMSLLVQPWDANLIPEIEKGILQSDLGLNPSNDGKVIRISIPALTAERREELKKVVRANSEDAKVTVRNVRREQIEELKKLEKDKTLSEDELRTAEEKMQEITNEFTDKIDQYTKQKEEELSEI